MTREEYIAAHMGGDEGKRFDILAAKRKTLATLEADYYALQTQSASISAGGGAKSYTQVALAEKWDRILRLRAEIRRDEADLGLASPPKRLRQLYIGSIG
jgi:hypothetical protein